VTKATAEFETHRHTTDEVGWSARIAAAMGECAIDWRITGCVPILLVREEDAPGRSFKPARSGNRPTT